MRVLLAVEDSTYGSAITDFVAKHKWEPGSAFKVLHAVQVEELSYFSDDRFCCAMAKDLVEQRDREARQLIEDTANAVRKALPGIPVEEQIQFGRAKEIILEVAEEWKADMIVVGSHGRKGFSRFFLGSVSLSVLSHAPCSVMIVRLPHAEEHGQKKQTTTTTAVAEASCVSPTKN